eukprot:scaffold1431_cov76-Cylindrotheca_fusiformis.AAC.4
MPVFKIQHSFGALEQLGTNLLPPAPPAFYLKQIVYSRIPDTSPGFLTWDVTEILVHTRFASSTKSGNGNGRIGHHRLISYHRRFKPSTWKQIVYSRIPDTSPGFSPGMSLKS